MVGSDLETLYTDPESIKAQLHLGRPILPRNNSFYNEEGWSEEEDGEDDANSDNALSEVEEEDEATRPGDDEQDRRPSLTVSVESELSKTSTLPKVTESYSEPATPATAMESPRSARPRQLKSSLSLVHSGSFNGRQQMEALFPCHRSEHLARSRFKTEFRELELVGTGGFGTVHKVHHYVSDKDYAVKKIHIKRGNKSEVEDLVREVRMLAKLDSHCNVVRYYNAWLEMATKEDAEQFRRASTMMGFEDDLCDASWGEDGEITFTSGGRSPVDLERKISVAFSDSSYLSSSGELMTTTEDRCFSMIRSNLSASGLSEMETELYGYTLYVQMEFVACSTLQDLLKSPERKAVNWAGGLKIVSQIANALEWIHSHDVIHRDLKPANLFIDKNGVVKLGDFGLAKPISDELERTGSHGRSGANKDDLSGRHNTVGVGTTIYASPEQLDGKRCTDRTDVFSLGIIMIEIYSVWGTNMERVLALSNARKGQVPDAMKREFPFIAEMTAGCIQRDSILRPSAHQIVENLLRMEKPKISIQPLPSPELSPAESPGILKDPHFQLDPIPADDEDLEDGVQLRAVRSLSEATIVSLQSNADSDKVDESEAYQKRVKELEDMVRQLLEEKQDAHQRIEELERTVQRQASLAASLLCSPIGGPVAPKGFSWSKSPWGTPPPSPNPNRPAA